MSATHGLAGRLLKRSRLLGLALVAAFALSGVLASGAGAVPAVNQTYLALGDSLAFGYSQQLFNEHLETGEPAAAFTHGYVDNYLAKINTHLAFKTTRLQNLGCPGETSGSLIGNGALEAGLKGGQELEEGKAVAAFGEAACAYHELAAAGAGFPAGFKFPLHTEYGPAGTSQLEAALGLIAQDAAEGKPVTHVTLNIGANDQLHFVNKCKAEATAKAEKGEIPPTKEAIEKAVSECLVAGAFPLGEAIGANIARILTVLRHGSSFGGVDYNGPIQFVAAYNPFGNLLAFPTHKEQLEGVNDEVLPGSNGLAGVFNSGFAGVVTKFGGCTTNELARFNPKNGTEPKKLQEWTNMTNPVKTEFPKESGKFLSNAEDIHPTPLGYKVMTAWMIHSCGV
ncbi:MAG TPA: SGNH/GDSL hydrolase family protein [Solirubrobacteraceae bacterium]|nr:SGNH/GDSL hydrolase family protein [Solirubrobacteraceae bacterium]